MKTILPLIVLLTFVLSACGDLGLVTAGPDPFRITPSRPPAILTVTPNIVFPTTSATLPPPPSLTPSATFTTTLAVGQSETPTAAPANTDTPTPTTSTNTPGLLEVSLLGCDTGIDITHSMGEVTNAYVTVANRTGTNLTNLCATLSSNDEGRAHPDKSKCIPSLPTGYQVTWKLTVDTTTNVNTIVTVATASDEGIGMAANEQACTDIGVNIPGDDVLGVILPIP
jgi:hypothetical protein